MNPLQTQVGGDHYAKLKIQPVEYIHANGLGFIEGSVIKYVTRHKSKGGKQDIEKAIHFLELLLKMEYGESAKKEDTVEPKYTDKCNARFINKYKMQSGCYATCQVHTGSIVDAELDYWTALYESTSCPICKTAASDAISVLSKA